MLFSFPRYQLKDIDGLLLCFTTSLPDPIFDSHKLISGESDVKKTRPTVVKCMYGENDDDS